MNDVIEAAIDEDPENRPRTYKKSAIATKIHCFDTLKSSKRKKIKPKNNELFWRNRNERSKRQAILSMNSNMKASDTNEKPNSTVDALHHY